MIYAITKHKYGPIFAFRSKTGSKIENAMYLMGHGIDNFHLTKNKPKCLVTKVRILDKWGYKIEIKQ